jgi:small subunit ribosomal protein S20
LPNIKSAKKSVKVISRRTERNQAVRSSVKTAFKKAVNSVASPEGETNVRSAVRLLDKAATKGVIHKNKAARKKSRLMRRLHAAHATT